ncbi:MAG: hypothetical protein E7331_10600 [Clostridiales bacterium]|nr:hypothetical protein [Clostridiales bacterium]
MSGKYDDIIGLPHHISHKYRHMPRENRAAQFAPFAALTGYEDAVEETARLTDVEAEVTDARREHINLCLSIIQEEIKKRPEVRIVYFRPDDKKAGGAYVIAAGPVRHLDIGTREVIFADGRRISLDSIHHIGGAMLPEYEG